MTHSYFIARYTIISQVAAPMLSCVAWALLELLVIYIFGFQHREDWGLSSTNMPRPLYSPMHRMKWRPMGHESRGSWVNYVMGHMGHGSQKMTHFQLWSVGKMQRFAQSSLIIIIMQCTKSSKCISVKMFSSELFYLSVIYEIIYRLT